MNRFLPYFLGCLLICVAQAEHIKLGNLTLKNGKTYRDVTILKKLPDGISIMHERGGARVPHEELPESIIEKIGGFNEDEVKAFRAKGLEASRKQALRAWQLDQVRASKKPEIKRDEQVQAPDNNPQLGGPSFRTWTDAKTGKTIEAKSVAKTSDGAYVKLQLTDYKTVVITTKNLSIDDQNNIAQQKLPTLRMPAGPVKLAAKSVAWGTKRGSWSYIWGNIDSDGAQLLSYSEKTKDSYRLLGLDLRCSVGSRGGEYAVEVYWFGFPLGDKKKRYICAATADTVVIGSGGKTSIVAAQNHNYTKSTLLYLESDPSLTEWRGFCVQTWIGYTYAGWAVRVSDGYGKVLAQQGSLTPLVGYLDNIPVPVLR